MKNVVTRTRKALAVVTLAAAGTLGAGAAHAGGNVYWSIGINAPLDSYGSSIGTVISNGPVYRPAPVYVQPAPVIYAPPPVVVVSRPVYMPPPVVVVRPRPVYVAQPAPVYVAPGHYHRHWKKKHKHWDDD